MKDSFETTVAFMQLFLLALWEGVGVWYFGWPPLAILLGWVVGMFTLNIATASVLSMYIKLTRPTIDNVVNLQSAPDLTEEDSDG